MVDTKEADIVINGTQLSYAESMTVRVALESFAAHLHDNGLGDDEHGIAMAGLYLKNIRSVRELIFRNIQ